MYDCIRRFAALAWLTALVAASPARAADVPTIAAAASLQFALTDIAAEFRRETSHEVRLAFGASGNLRRQIADGAPFELFLSADAEYADALVREHRALGPGVVYAVGRLVLFVPDGSPVKADPALRDVAAALRDGRLARFAIANPELAPYGRAARQVLDHDGLWPELASHLVLGENVSQALQFAASGAAQAGIVAYSLLKGRNVDVKGAWVLLPDADHEPLVQKMVLTKRAGATARAFADFVQAPAARAIFARYGFEPPAAVAGAKQK